MSTIALTNAAGGERVQEIVEIVTPQVNIVVPTSKLEVTPITTTVDYLCRQLADKSINLRPSYNRSYKWSMKKFRSYITHVWKHAAMLQSLTLYQLQEEDEYEYECIDGQHRLAALKHFYEVSPISELHSSDNMVYIDATGTVGTEEVQVALFYKETQATRDWKERTGRYVQYLNTVPGLMKAFNRIAVQLQTITSPLSISDKKRIFTDLQQGVRVTGDDLFRNLPIRLVEEIDAEVRPDYKETVLPRLTTKPSQYAIHWLIRFYHLSCKRDVTAASQATLMFKDMPDAMISDCLKSGSPDQSEFAYDIAGYEQFKRDMARLSTFCKECSNLPSQPKLPPITMHAVYAHFSKMDDAEYEANLPIVVSWMDRGQSDFLSVVQSRVSIELPEVGLINKVWEKTANDVAFDDKKRIYCISVEVLNEYTECRVMRPVQPKQKSLRKNLTKNIKKRVWDKYYGCDKNIVSCYVCDIKQLDRNDTRSYDYAHIIPHADGGAVAVDNLVPICLSCNSEMKTQNLHEFQKKHYQEVYAKNNL